MPTKKRRSFNCPHIKKCKTRSSCLTKLRNGSCKGMRTSTCRHTPMCKMAFGKKRSFCRSKKNKKRDVYYSS